MNLTAQPLFDQKNLTGIDDVLLALERLGHDLPRAELQQLDNFNRTYLIITRNVRQQLRKGVFRHPDFLERFDRRFAYYYLHALQQYLNGQKQVPHAWQQAFQFSRQPQASPFVAMALGVNAHVNNDIPQVLRDCKAGPEHYRDYVLVNSIIQNSLDEVIGLFRSSGSVLNPNRLLLNRPYKWGMRLLIRQWRRTAWRKFEQLQRQETATGPIEDRAEQLARGISKLPL